MKLTTTILALTAALLCSGAHAATAQSGGIQWLPYNEGRQQAKAQNKKVFLVFNADWCKFCLKMEKETFQHPSVVAYINRTFIPVSVNSDKETALTDKYKVRGLPSSFFISEKGDRIRNRPGYIAADEMLSILKFIGSNSYLTMSYKAFLAKGQ